MGLTWSWRRRQRPAAWTHGKALETAGGMIFDFYGPAAGMRDRRNPLDMIFVSRGSVVVAIMSYEPPMPDEFISASGPSSNFFDPGPVGARGNTSERAALLRARAGLRQPDQEHPRRVTPKGVHYKPSGSRDSAHKNRPASSRRSLVR